MTEYRTAGPEDPQHCRRLDDHVPHEYADHPEAGPGRWWCIGGPWASPGSVSKQAVDDQTVIELLAAQWRARRQSEARIGDSQRELIDDSYRFARDAVEQLKGIGVEVVVTPKGLDSITGVGDAPGAPDV